MAAAVFFTSTGCQTFRKKFVRERGAKKETPVYVDFKDYPAKITREAYIDYYLFVRSWMDDLIDAVRESGNYKRVKRAIEEALMNMEQIIYFYNDEGKAKIEPVYEGLLGIKEKIEANPSMGEVKLNALLPRIEHYKRIFESDFAYSDAKKWLDLDE